METLNVTKDFSNTLTRAVSSETTCWGKDRKRLFLAFPFALSFSFNTSTLITGVRHETGLLVFLFSDFKKCNKALLNTQTRTHTHIYRKPQLLCILSAVVLRFPEGKVHLTWTERKPEPELPGKQTDLNAVSISELILELSSPTNSWHSQINETKWTRSSNSSRLWVLLTGRFRWWIKEDGRPVR